MNLTWRGRDPGAIIARRRQLQGRSRGNTAEAAFPLTEFSQRGIQVAGLKVRPHAIGKPKFGVSTFPQQEVGKALLSASANQQVYFAALRGQLLSKHVAQQGSSR